MVCRVLALLVASSCSTNVRQEEVAPRVPPTIPTAARPVRHRPSGPFYVPVAATKVVPILRYDAPNLNYGWLDREHCEAELTRRAIEFGEATIAGVLEPVRLRGPLHGVAIHADGRSVHDVLDCRLALALDDFAELVAQSDVTEIDYTGAYRSKRELGCTAKYDGLQHCGALAIDVTAFKRSDGTTLQIQRDFHGQIGLDTCVDGVGPVKATHDADLLWSFACGAAERALFNVILTPNWNADHRNHFHLEITPDAGWMMVH